jgi:hypothetical protein
MLPRCKRDHVELVREFRPDLLEYLFDLAVCSCAKDNLGDGFFGLLPRPLQCRNGCAKYGEGFACACWAFDQAVLRVGDALDDTLNHLDLAVVRLLKWKKYFCLLFKHFHDRLGVLFLDKDLPRT